MPTLTCKNHPKLRWVCKEMAWDEPTQTYNGTRNLHYLGDKEDNYVPECKCPLSDLQKVPLNAH
jgi:hypothetical protein